jgi:hypothetical protein
MTLTETTASARADSISFEFDAQGGKTMGGRLLLARVP